MQASKRSAVIPSLLLGMLLGAAGNSGLAQEKPVAKADAQGVAKRWNRASESRVKIHFDVSYCQQNDPLQVADVYMPPTGDIEHQPLYPGILAIHGGAWAAGDKRFDALHCRKIAEQGYVVMAINYRLAPRHKHPAQIDDCREALRWLSEHAQEYHIDPDKLGVWGYSAGGHLAALLATDRKTEDPPIRVCVAGGAPAVRRDGGDERQLQHGDAVRRREDPLAHRPVPSRQRRAGSRSVEGGGSDRRQGPDQGGAEGRRGSGESDPPGGGAGVRR
ncbi:MAG: alpha/beta hydrolase [Planctomycetota bacterium]